MSSSSSSTPPTDAPFDPRKNRFRKVPDFGNASSNCFDLERIIRAIAVRDDGDGVITAQPVFIVDPCQAGLSPLKTATLVATNTTGFNNASKTASISERASYHSQFGGNDSVQEDLGSIGQTVTSLSNAAATVTVEIRNLHQILAIHMLASGGTATVTISVSQDNTTFFQVDSIAAALQTDLQYTLATNALNGVAQAGTVAGTGASTVKLNPLAWRYVKIVVGAAGVGFTTTTNVSGK